MDSNKVNEGSLIIENSNKEDLKKLINELKRNNSEVKNDIDKSSKILQNIINGKDKFKTKIEWRS